MQDWAEIRRLRAAEGLSRSEIARRVGVTRVTVRRALASTSPPRYQRAPAGSAADAYEDAIREQLARHPRMPATVIAERVGWTRGMTVQKNVLDRRTWNTRDELRIAIVTWIEKTYHRRRRQAALGRLTPVEYELIMKPAATQAA